MRIVSLNVGMPVATTHGDKTVLTGGYKSPVAGAVLRKRGFEGDGQADLVNHGSPDQAALVFAADHYPAWEKRLGRTLTPGAFSENLTVEGATEEVLCIGDIVRLGSAIVQVTQPRQPCGKLARKLGEPRLVDWIVEARQGGAYLRVLSEGSVAPGDAFEWIERHPDRISIATVNDVIYDRLRDRPLLEHLAALPEYSAAGRASMAKKLARGVWA